MITIFDETQRGHAPEDFTVSEQEDSYPSWAKGANLAGPGA